MQPASVSLSADLLPLACLAVITVALSVADLRTRRLPNEWMLIAALSLVAVFTVSTLVTGEAVRLAATASAAATFFVAALALGLIAPAHLGGGDVKLAGITGGTLGWFGLTAVTIGLVAFGLLLGAVTALAAWRMAGVKRLTIPLAPMFFGATWIGITVARFITS